MIDVRAAVIADADDLAQAHVQGWRVGYRGLFPDEYLDAPEFERERVDRWRAWTWNESGRAEVFVAVIDGGVVGFSLIGPARDQPETGEVFAFYLHPDAWGSGAASALMDRTVERLRARGFASAVLWVLRDNPRARRFYEKTAWQCSGRELMWEGPQTATAPPQPVAETQYLITL